MVDDLDYLQESCYVRRVNTQMVKSLINKQSDAIHQVVVLSGPFYPSWGPLHRRSKLLEISPQVNQRLGIVNPNIGISNTSFFA